MKKGQKKRVQSFAIILIAVALVLGVVIFTIFKVKEDKKIEAEVITVSTLEKIIKVSKLSTFTAVYNGIAEVMNEKNQEKIDFYVSYEARVDAGIDFEKIQILVNNDTKTINVDIPEVTITDITVDIASLDFIFFDEKANTSTVIQKAYEACQDDVEQESKQQTAIYEFAKQNAENVLKALINPIIEQLDAEYELIMD